MVRGFRSFQPVHLQVTNLSAPQNQDSDLSSIESREAGVSMEGNREVRSNRWKPTEDQKRISEQHFNAGERKPCRERVNGITNQLKVYGKVEAKNISYLFQNNHSSRKRQQQKELMQELSPEQNEVDGSYQTPIRFSPANVSSTSSFEPSLRLGSFEPSLRLGLGLTGLGFPEFSLQELANSRESASSTPTDTVLPTNLLLRPNLQLAENEAVCHNNRTIKKQKLETNSKGEYTINQKDIASPGTICSSITNAFSSIGQAAMSRAPFSPPTLTSSPESNGNETLYGTPGDVSKRNDTLDNGVTIDGWLRHFLEGRRNPRGGTDAGRHGNNKELLLFPLHPEGNLKSQIRQQD